MCTPAGPRSPHSRALVALVGANARYWTTVAPLTWRELRGWRRRARLIDDPALRAHALRKLREDDGNVKTTATLATLAPRAQRARVVRAIVALQVMYDYLDAVSEERFADGRPPGRRLFGAFDAAFCAHAAADWYRGHPRRDRSGYLDALAAACREALQPLPRLAEVAPLAAATAARSARAQELCHAVARGEPVERLIAWAGGERPRGELTWWELAAGGAASILAVHALIAAAGDPRTTRAAAERTLRAYLLAATLTTLLDSLVDRERDRASGDHSFVGYYAGAAVAAERIAGVARLTREAAAGLPRAPHHVMTVAGIAAFYLSAPGARSRFARPAAARVTAELQPPIAPLLWLFRGWRRLRPRRR